MGLEVHIVTSELSCCSCWFLFSGFGVSAFVLLFWLLCAWVMDTILLLASAAASVFSCAFLQIGYGNCGLYYFQQNSLSQFYLRPEICVGFCLFIVCCCCCCFWGIFVLLSLLSVWREKGACESRLCYPRTLGYLLRLAFKNILLTKITHRNLIFYCNNWQKDLVIQENYPVYSHLYFYNLLLYVPYVYCHFQSLQFSSCFLFPRL